MHLITRICLLVFTTSFAHFCHCSSDDSSSFSEPSSHVDSDDGSKRGWNALSGAWGKRAPAWNNLNGVWGKRNNWNNLSGMWGKRDWNNLSGMWGKRDWNNLSGMWGKRDWNNLSGMWGKRDWNNLSGMWGKRGWNELSGMWGKKSGWTNPNAELIAHYPENFDKKAWTNLNGAWGKRNLNNNHDMFWNGYGHSWYEVPDESYDDALKTEEFKM